MTNRRSRSRYSSISAEEDGCRDDRVTVAPGGSDTRSVSLESHAHGRSIEVAKRTTGRIQHEVSGRLAGPVEMEEEQARLAAVHRYEIDAPRDGSFDRIATAAAKALKTPMATVTIVDEDRVWLSGRLGVEAEDVTRGPGLCVSAILTDDVTVLADARLDPEALNNPLVRDEFGLRFYAAAPIITPDGYRLGTVNVMDTKPRRISEKEGEVLRSLADVVADQLELRLSARRALHLERQLVERAKRDKQRAEREAQILLKNLLLTGAADKLDEALDRVVFLGVQAMEADFGSVTLMSDERLHTVGATERLATRMDELQQETGQGPCLSATKRHAVYYLKDTAADSTWPDFSGHVAELGIRSVLAFTLWPREELLGALNFYSERPEAFTAFTPAQQDVGALLAAHAGALIMLDRAAELEQRLFEAVTVQEQLRTAIETRDVISTAKGILAEREGVTPEEAFDLLRVASQHLNQKLRDVARKIVEDERRRQSPR